MALTFDISDSDLFRLLTKEAALKHPTANLFSQEDWNAAYAAIAHPTKRDRELLAGAAYFGHELRTIREVIRKNFIPAYSHERGVQLLAAIANQQYLVLDNKVRKARKRLSRQSDTAHVEVITQLPIRGAGGQQVTADDHITQIVDALPHWLFHILHPPESATDSAINDPFEVGSRVLMTASIERSLRDLWQSMLWEGHKLTADERISISPPERSMAENWLIWHLRNSSNANWEAIADGSAGLIFGDQILRAIPVNARTVVSIEQKRGQKQRLIVGTAKGTSPIQRSHASERDALDRLYTGLFLDTPHPLSGELELTCRELNRAWWVLVDIARILTDELSGN
ncbi:MAG: hypothetical protein WD005_05265 [Haliea sp.]